ncbi:hypothetical protein ACFFX0_12830 [Citricoccus parietis]|uniref:Uncharacterized protein n=1 Tax=Citricoccus parietis TaxID=592307 RepID=A0ABV5FZF9_9MICC
MNAQVTGWRGSPQAPAISPAPCGVRLSQPSNRPSRKGTAHVPCSGNRPRHHQLCRLRPGGWRPRRHRQRRRLPDHPVRRRLLEVRRGPRR